MTEERFYQELINELTYSIRDNAWKKLVIGGEDEKKSFTHYNHNITHFMDQSRYFCNIMIYLHNETKKVRSMNWINCYKHTIYINYNKFSGRTVAIWYLNFFLHRRHNIYSI